MMMAILGLTLLLVSVRSPGGTAKVSFVESMVDCFCNGSSYASRPPSQTPFKLPVTSTSTRGCKLRFSSWPLSTGSINADVCGNYYYFGE